MKSANGLRGGGDVLSRRLASFRADILARGKPSFVCSSQGQRSFQDVPPSFLPRIFDFYRRKGASVCNVLERRTLCGLSCFVDARGVDWLLLSDPVPLSGLQSKNSVLISHERRKA